MGYYFEKAKTVKDLSPKQQERYNILRSKDQTAPPELLSRIEVVKEYIGPLTSGEIIMALGELVQDAVVTWVLAEEDSAKVEWVDPNKLSIPQPPPTEKEKKRAREWWSKFLSEIEEHEEQLPPKRTLREVITDFLWWW